MCLIIFAWKLIPDCPLVLAANRDEFFARPTQAANWWTDHPQIYAGRDLQAGGTWLGINQQGQFAALTNLRDGQAKQADKRTRGELTADYLSGEADALTYMRSVQEKADQYQGFNLIVGDANALYCLSNHGTAGIQTLAPGIYGLSNGELDTPWPKLVRAKAQFSSLLCQGAPDDAYFEMLTDTTRAADSRLPDTGVSMEWERLLSSICIESPDYGTRASSLLRLHANGHATLQERVIR